MYVEKSLVQDTLIQDTLVLKMLTDNLKAQKTLKPMERETREYSLIFHWLRRILQKLSDVRNRSFIEKKIGFDTDRLLSV